MTAGRDVERLVSSWLIEEAPGRAPDRILDEAGKVIDRTRQRRFVAEWREPMYVTLRGLGAAAAVLVVVVTVAAFAVRVGGLGSPQQTSSPPPTATGQGPSIEPAPVTLEAYREARNAICADLRNTPITDVPDWKANPSGAAAFLTQVIAHGSEASSRLEALAAPPEIAAEHEANVQVGRDTTAILQHELDLIEQGKVDDAVTTDAATGPLNAAFQRFEEKYGLDPCP